MATEIFRGNAQIKGADVKYSYTRIEVNEFNKCMNDPIYFIENYVKIINLNDGLVKFKLYPYQKEMITAMAENRRVALLTGRQQGKSTTSAAFLLWYVIFHKNKTVAILANKAAIAREILERMTLMLENIPFFIQPGCKYLNKGSITFSNGSRIMTAATSSSSIRGFSIDVLFLDEFAFVDDADTFFTSTYPVVSSGRSSKVIITSTPNGLNLFHKIWTQGKEGINGFVSLKYDWRCVPGRDKDWETETRNTISEEQFAQEFEGSFLGSSNTLIPPGKINELAAINPTYIGLDRAFRAYHEPVEGNGYVVIVDTSRGKGLDNSAFSVINITDYPFVQVATYYNADISPLLYPSIIATIATKYNEASVLVETNDIGEAIVNDLNYDLEYENIISTSLSNGRSSLGVRTTKRVKAIGCSTLKDLVANTKLIIKDELTIKEMSGFIQKGASYEADSGFNDDLMMTLVLFAWYTTTQDFSEMKSNFNIGKSIFGQQIDRLEEDLSPFGFINNGLESEQPQIEVEADGTVWSSTEF